MIRLIQVELTRLRWRRAVLLLLVGAFVVPAVIGATLIWDTRPISADQRAEAEQMLADDLANNNYEPEVQTCIDNPIDWGQQDVEGDELRAACEDSVLPKLDWYLFENTLDLGTQRGESFLAVAIVVAGLMLLVGATFVGQDWASGSMSNQLLFETRRTRIWVAKAVTLFVVTAVVAAVALAAFWLLLYAVASGRDLPTAGLMDDGLKQAGRGALVAGLAAVGGYALTMLLRSTVAVIGLLFAVNIAGAMLVAALPIDENEKWQPAVRLAAVIQDGSTYYRDVPESCWNETEGGRAERPECDEEGKVSALDGAGYLAALLLLVATPSVLSFRRRDVP